MILLDTNVVSENFRRQPNPNVIAWLDAQPANELYLCTPVLAELRFGAERLAPGRKRTVLEAAIDTLENAHFRGRILPLDPEAAAAYGRVAAMRQRTGRRIEQMDALIAAIALAQDATLATRDIDDFSDVGVRLINPFDLGRNS
jgi:predicted nucleic acid-binding protein